LGALAYAAEHGLSCPVYSTVPAKSMGHLAMYDAYLNKHQNGSFTLFTPDSIVAAWERIVPLKYLQHVTLEPTREGAAVAAGG
jgi:cleavage and polyadenylation specificity factor subunit 2